MHTITIDHDLCNGCKRCYQSCFNNVIVWDKEASLPTPKYPEECATCNWCEIACPDGAVKVIPQNPVRIPEPYPRSFYPLSYVTD